MKRLPFACLAVTGRTMGVGVAAATLQNDPETSLIGAEVERRLHDARHSGGQQEVEALQTPNEEQFAAETIAQTATGTVPGQSLESGVENAPRSVVHPLAWVPGVDQDQASSPDEIADRFPVRNRRPGALNPTLCDVALDPFYADLTFDNGMGLIAQELDDPFEFHGKFRMLLPMKAVVAVRKQANPATAIDQEIRDRAFQEDALEVPDLMRMSYAPGTMICECTPPPIRR